MSVWRYEFKYVTDRHEIETVRSLLDSLPVGLQTHHPPRWVNNVYFDDEFGRCVTENMSGISERFKVRLRWYGDPYRIVAPRLEVKIKKNYVNSKLSSELDGAFDLQSETWSDIVKRVRSLLAQSPRIQRIFEGTSRPTLINRYHRSYLLTSCGRVRVTLDGAQNGDIQFYNSRPNFHHSLPKQAPTIIEIKGPEKEHDTVMATADHLPFKRSRFSKYVYWMHLA